MKTLKPITLFLILTFSFFLLAQTEKEEEDFFDIQDNFFEIIAQNGLKEAIQPYLSKSAIFVGNKIYPIKEWHSQLEEGKTFEYFPIKTFFSPSMDLIVTIGTFKEKSDKKKFFFGNFLHIWKKEKEGYRIILIQNESISPHFAFSKPQSHEKIEIKGAKKIKKSALSTEEEIMKILGRFGFAKIYNDFADDKLSRIRENLPLENGKKEIFLKSINERGFIIGQVSKTITSKDKNMVIFIGKCETKGPLIKAKGSFIHILGLNESGEYKLLLDSLILKREDILRRLQ